VHQAVTILPSFFTFLTHVTRHALSFPRHLPTCTQHVPPNHRTYSHLRRTHVHYPIHPCPCLVPYGCAAASYHIPLTCSSMTHLSPLVLSTSPFGMLSDPRLCHRYIMFHLYQKPYASFLDLILYLASYTVSPFVPSFRLRPSPIYKPLSRCLCLSSLT
jgi:hypothetical protein